MRPVLSLSALLLVALLLSPGRVAATESWPATAIGRVDRVGTGGTCAGTLVGPRHVLTAAHCLLHPRTRLQMPPHQLHFHLPGGSFAGVAAVLGDGYRAGGGPSAQMVGRDWGVLVLERAPGVRPVPLLPRSLQALTDLVGRPLLRLGAAVGPPCGLTNIGQDTALLLHDCPVAGGDSGAPLLAGEGEDTVLLAMQVAILGFGGQPHNLALSAASLAEGVGRIVDDPAFAAP